MPSYGNDEGMTNTHTTKAQAMMEFEAQSELRSSLFANLVRTTGAGLTKTDAQATYGLRFGHSTYQRKDKEISFPTQSHAKIRSELMGIIEAS